MKRKGMGKRIATMVLAITMSISMAGFQTGIVKAEIAVETSEGTTEETSEGTTEETSSETTEETSEGTTEETSSETTEETSEGTTEETSEGTTEETSAETSEETSEGTTEETSSETTEETSTETTEETSSETTEETPAETSEENYNAEFYILKNVNVIPLENGSTQYPASNYTAKDLTNMVGTITSTAFVNLGDGLDVTGLNIAESFQSVQDVIEETPEDGYLETLKGEILTAQGFVDSFDNYDILWYVVKKAGGTYHVDGVVYNKTANYKTLAYDANTTESVDVPSSMAYPLGTKVQVAAQPSRTGYTFTGWNTQKDGKGTSYDAGADLILNDNTTLYAQWKKNTKTDVNFYIQLDSIVMDIEGDINRRPVNYFSGSVAQSTMNADVDTSFAYAGKAEKAADADSTIRNDYLGNEKYVKDCPTNSDVFANLQKDDKTSKKFAELNINVATLTEKNYDIYWYVVKYDTADGWHVDGILHKKTTNPGTNPEPTNPEPTNPEPTNPEPTNPEPTNPEPTNPEPTNPEPTNPGGGSTPGGTNPGGSTTPGGDSGTVVIPDDETPLAPGPDNDADTPSDNEESDSSNDDNDGITEIEDEDTPLSDGTDIEDEDVPLSDGSDLDDAETIIEDEDTPLSDNPLTGDSVSVLWAVLAVMAAMGLLVVFVAGKRKKED